MFLCLLLILGHGFGDIDCAQASDQLVTRTTSPSFLPAYIERDFCDENGTWQLRKYSDLQSLTQNIDQSCNRCQDPVLWKARFYNLVTTEGFSSHYQLPTNNTVEQVLDHEVQRWFHVRPQSEQALSTYCEWMKLRVQDRIKNVAQSQKNIVIQAYQDRVQACIQQLREQQQQLRAYIESNQICQGDIKGTTLNLALGTTAIYGVVSALCSHFKCSKSFYAVHGLYASYVYWQCCAYQECMQSIQAWQVQGRSKLQHNQEVEATLSTSREPLEKIESLFFMHAQNSQQRYMGKIELYELEEKRRLMREQMQRLIDAQIQLNALFEQNLMERHALAEQERAEFQSIIDVRILEHSRLMGQLLQVSVVPSQTPVTHPVASTAQLRAGVKSLFAAIVNKLKP